MTEEVPDQYKPPWRRKNGAAIPPPAGPAPEDVEQEIRRTISRHHAQASEIAELHTSLAHWKARAEIAEGENVRLQGKLDVLQRALATLEGQYQAGVQIWLNGYDALRAMTGGSVLPPPPQLQLPPAKVQVGE